MVQELLSYMDPSCRKVKPNTATAYDATSPWEHRHVAICVQSTPQSTLAKPTAI